MKLLVEVVYFDETVNGYGGRGYTYKTELPLKPFQKVLAPTYKGDKKALVTKVNLPDSAIDPAWAYKVKEIKEIDNGEK